MVVEKLKGMASGNEGRDIKKQLRIKRINRNNESCRRRGRGKPESKFGNRGWIKVG
jgi:hypothetical protein